MIEQPKKESHTETQNGFPGSRIPTQFGGQARPKMRSSKQRKQNCGLPFEEPGDRQENTRAY